jgi:hypothetical protein
MGGARGVLSVRQGPRLTCSAADEACPRVPGATLRLAIPYDDPKVADGTPDEAATYDERCAQIAHEMLFAFPAQRPSDVSRAAHVMQDAGRPRAMPTSAWACVFS